MKPPFSGGYVIWVLSHVSEILLVLCFLELKYQLPQIVLIFVFLALLFPFII